MTLSRELCSNIHTNYPLSFCNQVEILIFLEMKARNIRNIFLKTAQFLLPPAPSLNKFCPFLPSLSRRSDSHLDGRTLQIDNQNSSVLSLFQQNLPFDLRRPVIL